MASKRAKKSAGASGEQVAATGVDAVDRDPAAGLPAVIAGVVGSCGFSLALLSGLFAGQEGATVLSRAVLALIACYAVGLCVGHAARRVVEERLAAHFQANPMAERPEELVRLEQKRRTGTTPNPGQPEQSAQAE